MPRVSYSEEARARIRQALVSAGQQLMARQGIQQTTVEQVCRQVGISRTFFYTFFPAKEDLILEALYLQQPKILAYAQALMGDPALTWREGVARFLHSCCYGGENGFAILTVEEQQQLFRHLSPGSYQLFRARQMQLFGQILSCFGVRATPEWTALFANISLSAIVIRRAIPHTLPLFFPEAADAATDFQINSLVDLLAAHRAPPAP